MTVITISAAWVDGWVDGWKDSQMGRWMIPPQFLNFKSLNGPYSDTVPCFPEFCAFFPKPVGYSDINESFNPEAGRECQDHLVRPLTVQMGSPGPEGRSGVPDRTAVWWQCEDRDLATVSLST